MSSDAVGGASLTQTQKGTALVQLRSSQKFPQQAHVASFLAEQGQKLGSNLLSLLAQRVNADPFGKVKKMIKDMVMKLMEEANEEAEHKAFCDTEMGTNKQTRDQKAAEVDELTASIEEMTAETAKMATEIKDLNDQIAEIDAAVAKATTQRAEEKAKNS